MGKFGAERQYILKWHSIVPIHSFEVFKEKKLIHDRENIRIVVASGVGKGESQD